jgi:hypothetical protein
VHVDPSFKETISSARFQKEGEGGGEQILVP